MLRHWGIPVSEEILTSVFFVNSLSIVVGEDDSIDMTFKEEYENMPNN